MNEIPVNQQDTPKMETKKDIPNIQKFSPDAATKKVFQELIDSQNPTGLFFVGDEMWKIPRTVDGEKHPVVQFFMDRFTKIAREYGGKGIAILQGYNENNDLFITFAYQSNVDTPNDLKNTKNLVMLVVNTEVQKEFGFTFPM